MFRDEATFYCYLVMFCNAAMFHDVAMFCNVDIFYDNNYSAAVLQYSHVL